jgi:hypothetical protein
MLLFHKNNKSRNQKYIESVQKHIVDNALDLSDHHTLLLLIKNTCRMVDTNRYVNVDEKNDILTKIIDEIININIFPFENEVNTIKSLLKCFVHLYFEQDTKKEKKTFMCKCI